MSDMREDMLRTLDRIVADTVTLKLREAADDRASGGQGQMSAGDAATGALWAALADAGMTAIGSGGDDDVTFADAMALVRRAGYHALPVPLAETIIARRVLARAGIAQPDGSITIASPGAGPLGTESGSTLSGTAKSLAYGRSSAHAVVATAGHLYLLDARDAISARGTNMAGEPRDAIDLGRAKVVGKAALRDAALELECEGALIRSIQLAGALTASLDHALTWVNDRIQFGKPIAKHQAVQHLMAQLAEETAAAGAACDLAVDASVTAPDRLTVAIAKSRSGEAAGKSANVVHAVFGAMGFTREHALHYTTRRLWSWRNEFGSEVYWQAEIGRAVAKKGGAGLWPLLTSLPG